MEETQTQEPLYRFNYKQTSKGQVYCEVTVRGNNLNEVKQRIDEMKALVKEHSTVNEEGI